MSKFTGFISVLDEAAKGIKRGSGTGQAFINDLKKAGVKPVELKERGLDKIAELPKLTKPELIKRIEAAPPPKIKEKMLGEPDEKALRSKAEEMMNDEAAEEVNDILGKRDRYNRVEWDEMHLDAYESRLPDLDDYMRQAKEMVEGGEFEDAPKYTKYTLPGSSNHREILLKLPHFDKAKEKQLMELEANLRRMKPEDFPPGYVDSMQEAAAALRAEKEAAGSPYQSSHWDDPNVLAHMRVSDRKGPKGEKVLHIEEVQSDWHQQGKEQGYRTGREEQDYSDYLRELELKAKNDSKASFIAEGMSEEKSEVLADRLAKRLAEDPRHLADYFGSDVRTKQQELLQARISAKNAIPDAPFKENWHELAMKRLLNYAAENGYDKIAITPGMEQAKRYKLSQEVGSISYNPETQHFQAFKPNRETITSEKGVGPDRIAELVGKEASDKLMQSPQTMGHHYLEGEDMDIGGEGMKRFYDQRLPSFLNKYGQPHGVQVSPFDVETHPEVVTPQIAAPGIGHFPEPITEPAKTSTLHGFDITPEMREELINRGLPMYKRGGQIKKRGRVHVSQNPDTMLLDLMSRS